MIEVDILQIIKDDLKIDFADSFVDRWGGGELTSRFEIKPKEFLRFAKSDFEDKSIKGELNALTNCKRAIDCQIDSVLDFFCIDFSDIPDCANSIIQITSYDKEDISRKFKLIGALDFAPSIIISDVRRLRNKLEHQYKRPTQKEIKDAIELAELFISAVENKTKFIEYGITLSDLKKHSFIEEEHRDFYKAGIDIAYDMENRHFVFKPLIDNNRQDGIKIDSFSPVFYFLIRIFVNINDEYELRVSLILFLRFINHPLPEKHMKISIN